MPYQYLGLIYSSVSASNVRSMVAARAYFINVFIFCKKVRFFTNFFRFIFCLNVVYDCSNNRGCLELSL